MTWARGPTQLKDKIKYTRWSLTTHAIVGEPLAELVDHDEEDAQGVAAHHYFLRGRGGS